MSNVELSSLAKSLEADPGGFQTFADAVPNFVWVTRGDGTPAFYNARFLEYAGASLQQALEQGFSGLVYPDDAPAAVASWNDSLATGKSFEGEYRLCRASDKTYRWFLTRAVPVHGASGRIDYWLGTATDIDAQKRAVENLDFVIEASAGIAAAETVEAACDEFARLAVQRVADWCVLVLRNTDGRYEVAAADHREGQRASFREASPFLERLLARNETVFFPTISEELLRQQTPGEQVGFYSAIVAPMEHAGEPIGGIVIYSAESRRQFHRSDADVLHMLAQRTAVRIEALRTLGEEQRARRRLQFVGRATHAVYESFDLATAFGNLTGIVVSEIGDMAAVFRLENGGAARVVGAAHRDPDLDDVVRSLVGIRVMHAEAERRFVRSLQRRKPLVGTRLQPGALEKTVWPYLGGEIAELAPRALVTVPLHSRGKVHGAIVLYYCEGGRSFNPDDADLLVDIARHASVALENADVFERERRMSETLQDSLLPPSLPDVAGLSFDAVYLPSATGVQVGGDWYDAFQLEDGTTVVSAGDVTGRGADAAVIMGKVRHLLAIAPSYERDPARILDTVESVLTRRYPDAIVTAFLGLISADRASMTYASAGHPPALLRRSNGLEELHAQGLPLGLRREAAPALPLTVDLRDARMIVLYTDGLTEAGHDVIAGTQRLHETVARDAVLHTHRPAQLIEELCLGNASTDDVAVLTISFESGIRWTFDAENAKAAQDARGEFVAYLRRYSADCEELQTAELVFGELIGNVVRHAPGAIDIDVDWRNGSPVLHVLDRGPAFQPPSHLPEDVLSESGRGLFIVQRLSKTLNIEHVPGYGNYVCVELPIRPDAADAGHHASART